MLRCVDSYGVVLLNYYINFALFSYIELMARRWMVGGTRRAAGWPVDSCIATALLANHLYPPLKAFSFHGALNRRKTCAYQERPILRPPASNSWSTHASLSFCSRTHCSYTQHCVSQYTNLWGPQWLVVILEGHAPLVMLSLRLSWDATNKTGRWLLLESWTGMCWALCEDSSMWAGVGCFAKTWTL